MTRPRRKERHLRDLFEPVFTVDSEIAVGKWRAFIPLQLQCSPRSAHSSSYGVPHVVALSLRLILMASGIRYGNSDNK